MRWLIFNVLGAGSWVCGLVLGKAAALPTAGPFDPNGYRFELGMCFGLVGLAILLWANFAKRGVD